MNALLLSLCLLAAPVHVELAPDQPLNFIYIDDPLIVELRSDTDREVNVRVKIEAEGEKSLNRNFDAVPLRSAAVRWLAVDDLPARRGYYNAQIRVQDGDEETRHDLAFCRIDRPRADGVLPVYARSPIADQQTIVALRHAGIMAVRLSAGPPSLLDDAQYFSTHGFEVVVRFSVEQLASLDLAALAPHTASWEIAAPNEEAVRSAVRAIRDAGSSGPASIVVKDAEEFTRLLTPELGDIVRETVVEGPAATLGQLAAVRKAANAAGYEHWSVSAGRLGGREDGELAIGLVEHIGFGTRRVGIDTDAFVATSLKAPYVRLHGLSQHLQGVEPAGSLSLGEDVHAPVFRSGAHWLVVVWTDGENRRIEMALPKVNALALADGANNALATPDVVDGVVQFDIGPRPRYLQGIGGEVLGRAAANQVRTLASRFASEAIYREYLPAALIDNVRTVAKLDEHGVARTAFFGIIREFPEIEARWHGGKLPQNVAAPALADLRDLTRALCAVEERSEDPFLEPLGDMLARCDEYQSVYLTNSPAESHHRGDWLLGEVRRLADEARRLDDEGRRIEASALGALAEWRARALDAAANAGTQSEITAPVQLAAADPEDTAPATADDAVSSTVVEQPAIPEEDDEEMPSDTAPAEVEEDAATEPAEEMPTPEVESEATTEPADAESETETAPAPDAASTQVVHLVKSGENPSVIAAKHGIRLSELLAWNNLGARSRINIGDKLFVSAPGGLPMEPGQPANTRKVVHTVKSGENPSIIAKNYGVDQRAFEKWNNLRHNTALRAGKQYTVYVPVASADATKAAPLESGQPAGTTKTTHTVARGDSPYTIAQKYRVSLDNLLLWNKLTKRSVLQIGQKLTVYQKK